MTGTSFKLTVSAGGLIHTMPFRHRQQRVGRPWRDACALANRAGVQRPESAGTYAKAMSHNIAQ